MACINCGTSIGGVIKRCYNCQKNVHSYIVEIDDNNNSISILPNRTIPTDHMKEILTMVQRLGYSYWKPGGPDGEFILSKEGE